METINTLWPVIWPYIGAVVAVASALDASLPQPAPGSHWLVVRKLLSFLAINVGSASNGAQPSFDTWLLRIVTPILEAKNALPAAPVPVAAPTSTEIIPHA